MITSAGEQNQVCGLPMELLRCLATYGLASRIGYELRGWEVEFLRHSDMWGLASRIRYEAMWLAKGTPEASNYVGCESVCCGAVWEANEFPELFGYEGWPFRSGMLLCGWRVAFMRHSAMLAGK